MKDIGRKLLQSIGLASPDDVSIQAAIEANDAFIASLRGFATVLKDFPSTRHR
jgi:hypothetical protein